MDYVAALKLAWTSHTDLTSGDFAILLDVCLRLTVDVCATSLGQSTRDASSMLKSSVCGVRDRIDHLFCDIVLYYFDRE